MAALAACPSEGDHTPAPAGYLAWHEWAAEKAETHHQIRCSGCGLLKIWVPNDTTEDTAA